MAIEQTQLSIEFSGKITTGTAITVKYDALQGANPGGLDYFVAIWQGSQIMGIDTALLVQKLTGSSRAGDFIFDGLKLKELDYTVGFGVNSGDGTTICNTIFLPSSTGQGQSITGTPSKVSVQSKGNDTLTANFETPAYNIPDQNKNWVALFEGNFTANMFSGLNVKATKLVDSSNNNGAVYMNGIDLVRFQNYTLVYGMGVNKDGSINYSNIVSATQFNNN